MVGAIAGSAAREPTTVGKPSTFMLDDIADQFKIDKSEICMVGDRLDTVEFFGGEVKRTSFPYNKEFDYQRPGES